MHTRAWTCAVAAAVVLVGCGTTGGNTVTDVAPPTPGGTHTCVFTPCQIQVWVDETSTPPKVQADFTTMKMYTRTQSATIVWALINSQNYEFRHDDPSKYYDPIIFKGPNIANAPNQFDPASWKLPSPRQISVTNANTDKLKYDYTIRVYVKRTPANPNPNPAFYELDPAIINDY